MLEYQVFGIDVNHPDATVADALMRAALGGDRLARLALADLIESHGDPICAFLSGLLRNMRHHLGMFGEGSVNLAQYDDDGEFFYAGQIGWHLPTAQEYQDLQEARRQREAFDDIPF